jgi:hypothetical protein
MHKGSRFSEFLSFYFQHSPQHCQKCEDYKYFKNEFRAQTSLSYLLQCVPLATEPGISLIILPLMRILQRNLKHTTDAFLFIYHATNVLLFKFRCNIFIGVRIIKEMPGSVASGTSFITTEGRKVLAKNATVSEWRSHLQFAAFNIPSSNRTAVPLQAWSGPEGSRKFRFPDYMTTAQDGGKVVSLTQRPTLPPGNTPGSHLCYRLSRP